MLKMTKEERKKAIEHNRKLGIKIKKYLTKYKELLSWVIK